MDLHLDLWPRQIEALTTEGTELLFGGATRGGKSHLARVMLIVSCLQVPNLQCTLIRKKIQDILDNHVHGPNGFRDLLAPLIAIDKCTVTQEQVSFFNGSRIVFKHCQDERQFDTAQGITSHILVVDEATQISERLLRVFRGWCTMSEEMQASLPDSLKGKLPRILYTANPIGPSVNYFRREFVKARPAHSIQTVGAFKRQFIPSKVADNPSENAEAVAGRMREIGDAAVARALLEGDWDAPVGDFLPEYDDDRHAVPDFTPPSDWFRFRAFDWGTAEPFACYWFAVSDGESFKDGYGRDRWFPRGALIAYREWYGCDPESPSHGIRMRNEDMAYGILARSPAPEERNLLTVTDSLPFQDRGGKTIAETFRECGCPLLLGDTTRVAGWSQLRSRLIGAKIDSNDERATPMLFLVESCIYARDYLPALPRHPSKSEDAAESGEATHAPDALRLACMARARVNFSEPKEPSTANIRNDFTFNQIFERIQKFKRQVSGSY